MILSAKRIKARRIRFKSGILLAVFLRGTTGRQPPCPDERISAGMRTADWRNADRWKIVLMHSGTYLLESVRAFEYNRYSEFWIWRLR